MGEEHTLKVRDKFLRLNAAAPQYEHDSARPADEKLIHASSVASVRCCKNAPGGPFIAAAGVKDNATQGTF